jgi:hypothetical protein
MPRTIELRFPNLGVIRRQGLRVSGRQENYPTPWALNVRLEDSLTNRLRGGSFAGIASTALVANREVLLVTSGGDQITDTANPLFAYTEESIASGDDYTFINPGGSAPAESAADVIYRDRLIRVTGNEILASRHGAHQDFNYGDHVDDPDRAWAIQLSEAGEVGDAVTALIPHKDRNMLGFTATSMWAIQGDPTADGSMRNVSRDIGCVTARSWAKDHLDRVYFLSAKGLYAVNADGSGLQAISENSIPEHLTGVTDPNTVLQYSHDDRGLYIEIPTADVSWFYDTERESFWPYDTGSTNSHVAIGPVRIGGPNRFGRLLNMHGIIAAGSGTVNWRIITGNSAEEAADNAKLAIEAFELGNSYATYVKAAGDWTAGRAIMAYPRTRTVWAVIWIQASSTWAYEGVVLEVEQSGKWRGAC